MTAQPPDDGGAAFPRFDLALNTLSHGMTLRDYFAGQALAGLLAARSPEAIWSPDGRAIDAYQQADAMLQARRPAPEKGERT